MPQLRILMLPILVGSLSVWGPLGCGDDDGPTDAPDADAPDGGEDEGMCPREPSVCGNGVVEPGESCDPPDSETCDEDCQRIPQEDPDPACDLTGHWAVEKVTVSAALEIQATTRNRMYYHIVQDGEDFEIVDSLDCALFVEAPLLSVTIAERTREALRCMVNSTGRTGTSTVSDDTCEIHFDTLYTVRGLSPVEHWLDDDWATETMEPATPNREPPPDPDCVCDADRCECDDTGRYDPATDTPGWEDWDQDGGPGITLRPGGARWYVHMRDWDRFDGTTAQGSAGDPLDDIELEVEWWNVQGLMAHTQDAIVVEESPDLSADHYVTLKRIEAPDRNALTDAQVCQAVLNTFQ